MNEGFKEFYIEENSLKRFRYSVNRRTLKIEIVCAHPLPTSPLLLLGMSKFPDNLLNCNPQRTGVSTPPSPEIPKKSRKGVPAPPGLECQKSVERKHGNEIPW